MKKRTKIIAISITLCMCLSLFVVGVLANITASFSVSSTLNFVADGVYVMAQGEVRLGSSKDSAAIPEEIPSGSDYDYTGYSYTPISAGTNNAPDASQPATGFSDNWEIKDINFSSENKVVVYYFKFTNYSNFDVAATCVTNISTVESNLANHIDVQTYVDGSVTSVNTYNVYIPAASNNVPGEKTLEVVITLTNLMEPISQEALDFTFTFAQDNDTTKYFNIIDFSDVISDDMNLLMFILLGIDLTQAEFQPNDKAILGLSDIGITHFSSAKDITLPSEDVNGNKIIFASFLTQESLEEVASVSIKNLTIPEGYKYVVGYFDENLSTVKIPATLQSFNFNTEGISTTTGLYMDNLYFEVAENSSYLFSVNGALYKYGTFEEGREGNTLLYVPGANYSFELPTNRNITDIGEPETMAFINSPIPTQHFEYRRNFTTFEVPNFITHINSLKNSSLQNLTVNGDVVVECDSIKSDNLKTLIFNGNVTFENLIGSDGQVGQISASSLEKLVFNGDVSVQATSKGYGMGYPKTTKIYFNNVSNLTTAELEEVIGINTAYMEEVENVYFLSSLDISSLTSTLTTNYYTNSGTVQEDGKSYIHFVYNDPNV